ncbi:Alpha/beta hydrolase family protein [Corynebacterium faecale]|uniref:alpha/beta fold hydrolase n=1 Tax=Corynebacterium faecale TaxID=1758466 RepID=UPI0025B422FF|nr:alpha/beta hydrolase [Corynebacterium faecale]WJY93044.1 Alpha/beta hydrolase family protein [Corynebacterium faecale]
MINPYEAFLPLKHRTGIEPVHTWWEWRGLRVHIARARRPKARARVLVIHGMGAHSGALWPHAAALAERGFEVLAVDLPLFGLTVCEPTEVLYDDWIALLVNLIDEEHDGRPMILFGASVGGLLAAEVASKSTHVSHVVATCLMDPADPLARRKMTRFGSLGILATPFLKLAPGRKMVRIRALARISKMSRSPALSMLCASDELGGGVKVPLRFLVSYLGYKHTMPTVPITLVHPGHDDWTPEQLSLRTLKRAEGPTDVVMLRECGHFPIEEPGLTDLFAVFDRLE